jgi:serine protease Do
VVSIHTVSKFNNPLLEDPMFALFFGGGLQPKGMHGGGSGVIVDPRGYVVTCAHVVARATVIRVTIANVGTFKAEVVYSDQSLDLAVLRLQLGNFKGDLPFCEIANELTEIGDDVIAMGNAFSLGLTVTRGIVSAIYRIIEGRVVFQTDAAINPGNSGGPVLNRDGRLIGIASAIYSRHGSFIGIGFFVPWMAVRFVMNRAINRAKDAVVPFQVSALEHSVVAALHDRGAPIYGGCEVGRVFDHSSGIKPRDVILSVANMPATRPELFSFFVRMIPVGTQYQIQYIKADDLTGDGRPRIQTVIVEAKAKEEVVAKVANGVKLQDKHILNDVVVADADVQEGGVVVLAAPEGSVVCKGDVIIVCNHEKISCVADLESALNKASNSYMLQMKRQNAIIMLQGTTADSQRSEMF